MRKLQKLALVLVLMLGLGLLVGCSGDEKKLKDIQVSPEAVTLDAGQIKELEVKPVPADAELPAVEFTSSNSTIVSVGKDGKMLAVKAGEVEITVTAGGFTKKVVVTVNQVLATDLEVGAKLALEVGAKAAISYAITPKDATTKVPSFESLNPAVATVNAEGEVIGVAAGEAIIKVKVDAIEKEVAVTVTAPVVERTYPFDGEFTAFEASLNYGAPMYTMVTVKIENDEVVSFNIDALQSKKNEAGTNYDWNAKTKKELGYLYGMHNVPNADAGYERQDLSTEEGLAAYQAYLAEVGKKEWFEQAALLEAAFLESTDLEVDEAGTITSVAGVTIQDGGYSKLAKAALANAKAGKTVKLAATSNYGSPNIVWVEATVDAKGAFTALELNTLQGNVVKNAEDVVTGYAWNEKNKQELGYLYGMHNVNNADAGYERQDLSTEAGLAAYQAYLTEQGKLEWFEQANMITAYALENGLAGLVMDDATKKLDGSVEALAGVSVTVDHYLAVLEAVYAAFPQA
ncbi:MAG TPA: Ig domain-containing protein [Acholeplasma sp.]|jgi:hypothetical protein|nr:Ig domain-containing protein [Acholeplasma sp.]